MVLFINNYDGATAEYVTNSVFTGNTDIAVYAYTSLQHCEIYGNNIGAEWDGHYNTAINYNYIHDNTIGVQLDRFWNDLTVSFNNNKICSNSTWNIQYDYTNNADLSNNCWCSTDSSYVRSKIRDGYVNSSYGLISYNTDNSCIAGISDVKTLPVAPGTIKLYPNPFYDHATLVFTCLRGHQYKVIITDQLGRTIKTMDRLTSGTVDINRDYMAPGLYFYSLMDERHLMNAGKFVVQ